MAYPRNQGGVNTDAGVRGSLYTNIQSGSGGGLHPASVSLLVMVILELALYAALRHYFRTAHGG
jgi:hypothetical protein